MQKVADGHGIQPEEMMILMLKARTNHFAHLDQDLRNEMIELRKDMDLRFQQHQEELKKLYQALNAQAWKMIGAIGLIVALARLAGNPHSLAAP